MKHYLERLMSLCSRMTVERLDGKYCAKCKHWDTQKGTAGPPFLWLPVAICTYFDTPTAWTDSCSAGFELDPIFEKYQEKGGKEA